MASNKALKHISLVWIENYLKETGTDGKEAIIEMVESWAAGRYPVRRTKHVRDYPDFTDLYDAYMHREFPKKEFARRIGVSRPTLDKLIREYEETDGISEHETPRKGNWQIATQYLDDEQIWQCYRRRNVHPVDCAGDREYDKTIFHSKKEAADRCRNLNAMLVQDSWMADGHPRNW